MSIIVLYSNNNRLMNHPDTGNLAGYFILINLECIMSEKKSINLLTPLYEMKIDSQNKYFIKRDDLIPISFGGNKARKAILFFKDIERTNSDCIVTYGSSSSNHCRIIANIAASRKFPCYIISPLETNRPTYNSKMIELFGAKIIRCHVSEVKETIDRVMLELKSQGYKPYFIQGGGHGNIGTQAYVDAYEEIKDYERIKGIHFDYIFHASGTGTTQAGLICGKILNNDNKKIIGISIARKNPYGGQVVLNSVNNYLESIYQKSICIDDIDFVDDYVIDGYGTYNTEIIHTIKEILMNEGISLDTTYTGKAFWGMKQYVKKNGITGKNILFIHTGGTPLFFDDLEGLTNEF